MEKSSLSELFALRKNEDFLALWKNLKNGVISALTNFELMEFKTSAEIIKGIMLSEIPKIREFLRDNKDHLFDLKEHRFLVAKYLFSIVFGIISMGVVAILIYRSPKLQNKKFV